MSEGWWHLIKSDTRDETLSVGQWGRSSGHVKTTPDWIMDLGGISPKPKELVSKPSGQDTIASDGWIFELRIFLGEQCKFLRMDISCNTRGAVHPFGRLYSLYFQSFGCSWGALKQGTGESESIFGERVSGAFDGKENRVIEQIRIIDSDPTEIIGYVLHMMNGLELHQGYGPFGLSVNNPNCESLRIGFLKVCGCF